MIDIAGGIILAVIGLYALCVVVYWSFAGFRWFFSAFRTDSRLAPGENCRCCGFRTRERYCPNCGYGIRPVTTAEESEYW